MLILNAKKNKLKQNKKQVNIKPIVFITVACSFFIDHRVNQEVASLIKNGFYAYILSWDRERKYSDKETENYYVKSAKLLDANKFSKILFLLSAILFQFLIVFHGIKLIRKHKRIIIHANDFNTLAGVIFLKIIFANRIQVIYDSHEFTRFVYKEWYGPIIGNIVSSLEIKFIKYFDKIITVSTPIKKYLETISNKDVKVIWNYPTESLLPKISKAKAKKALGFKANDFVLIYVGTLRIDVALFELISAVSILKEKQLTPNLKILIVGDGPFLHQIHELVEKKHLSDIVRIIGRVEREKAMDYLRAADISYILFSLKGMNTRIGMPWKLFESLLNETRVLTMTDTYAAHFAKKYNVGYTVASITPIEIANTISTIYKQKDKDDFNLPQKFVWENQEAEFLKIYLELIQESKS